MHLRPHIWILLISYLLIYILYTIQLDIYLGYIRHCAVLRAGRVPVMYLVVQAPTLVPPIL